MKNENTSWLFCRRCLLFVRYMVSRWHTSNGLQWSRAWSHAIIRMTILFCSMVLLSYVFTCVSWAFELNKNEVLLLSHMADVSHVWNEKCFMCIFSSRRYLYVVLQTTPIYFFSIIKILQTCIIRLTLALVSYQNGLLPTVVAWTSTKLL